MVVLTYPDKNGNLQVVNFSHKLPKESSKKAAAYGLPSYFNKKRQDHRVSFIVKTIHYDKLSVLQAGTPLHDHSPMAEDHLRQLKEDIQNYQATLAAATQATASQAPASSKHGH